MFESMMRAGPRQPMSMLPISLAAEASPIMRMFDSLLEPVMYPAALSP